MLRIAITTTALALSTSAYAESSLYGITPVNGQAGGFGPGSVNGTTIALNQRITGGIIAWYLNGMPENNLLSQSPLPPSYSTGGLNLGGVRQHGCAGACNSVQSRQNAAKREWSAANGKGAGS